MIFYFQKPQQYERSCVAARAATQLTSLLLYFNSNQFLCILIMFILFQF
jgi:hypothetical protein